MRPRDMHRLAHSGCHDCAPKGWRDIPKVSGDYDVDATIVHRKNRDMEARLSMYAGHSTYGPRTGYSGYRTYEGDD